MEFVSVISLWKHKLKSGFIFYKPPPWLCRGCGKTALPGRARYHSSSPTIGNM
jgi:hypothetical protein